MTDQLVRYRSFIADSSRWGRFPFRPDDIVLTVPSKSGTTWLQTIVALLVLDGLPDDPVTVVAPWLDSNLRTDAEVLALLDAQTHRRFMKTHTPLDGIPQHDSVTYVTVGRDPRDVFASMRDHNDNADHDALHERRVSAVGDDDLAAMEDPWPDPADLRASVAAFIDLPASASSADVNLANTLRHLRQAWDARYDDNKVLLHYRDLVVDLPAQMRRLRDGLGLPTTDARVDELASLATMDAMRDRAAAAAPEVDLGAWKDPTAFFRKGSTRDGAALLTDEETARYEQRCHDLHGDDPAFLRWVRAGAG